MTAFVGGGTAEVLGGLPMAWVFLAEWQQMETIYGDLSYTLSRVTSSRLERFGLI